MKTLDLTNLAVAMQAPEGFRAERGESRDVRPDGLALQLAPYALVRVDSEEAAPG